MYWLNPPSLVFHDVQSTKIITASIIASTVVLPVIAILMMKGLNLISSLDMKDKKERVGPLIITGIFYLWIYLNTSKHSYVPDYIVYFILGTIITLFVCFFLNLFFKISLHAAGISGLISGLYAVINEYQYNEVCLNIFNTSILLKSNVILLLLILIAGIVGSARLALKEHESKEIYWGYGVGILAMSAAAVVVFGWQSF